MHIGNIGASRPAIEDDFVYCGETIRVNPDYSELDMVDFVERSQDIDENDPKAILMVKDLFRSLVHGDDFETFWKVCKKNRQTAVDMLKVYTTVVEALAKRPTELPSGSSTGRQFQRLNSKDASYLEVLTQLDGRADLQAVAVLHHEALQRG